MTDEEQKAVIDHPGFQGMVRTAINCQNSRVFMEDGQWTALGNPTDSVQGARYEIRCHGGRAGPRGVLHLTP